MQSNVKPGEYIGKDDRIFEYHVKSTPRRSNLDLITYGKYVIKPSGSSDEMFHNTEEALLFCLDGPVEIHVEGSMYLMKHYDVLYIPLQTSYYMVNNSIAPSELIICKAPAVNRHEVFFSEWEKIRKDESRIRHLEGKDVFISFDVGEKADKLVAGFTIYEPFTRAWPPHNHTDQEEIYIFTRGKGSMEVYVDEKSKTFVRSLDELDAVTIPVLNYHPVFSQEQSLDFIWCIAGERYWIGDKNQDFVKGGKDSITT